MWGIWFEYNQTWFGDVNNHRIECDTEEVAGDNHAMMRFEEGKDKAIVKEIPPAISEVRVHSKWGGETEPWFVTIIFDNDKQSTFNDSFEIETEAESFKKGVIEGLKWHSKNS